MEFGSPLQYSVFVCDLSDVERVRCREAVRGEMDLNADSVAMFDLGPVDGRGIRCVEYLGMSASVDPPDALVW
jgi:CRISPR-associated protein Cas2